MVDSTVTNGMDSRVWLLVTLLLYAVGALHVLLFAMLRRSVLTTVSLTATLLGFASHTAALALRWQDAGHFPAFGLRDGACLLAWAIVLVFLLVYVTTRVDAAGLFAYPFTFALVFVANLAPAAERADPVLLSLYLPLHLFMAVFGYGALFAAFTMGVLYLFQEKELRSRAPRRFYYLTPSLERSDTIGGRSVLGGFGFLTLAIVTGFFWNHSLHGRYWTGDPKEWAALCAWAIYVVLLVARWRGGWGGRRAAWLAIAGFAIVVFTFAWATLFPGVVVAAR
jgi:ABC-type transport system involved in cytochrome c biogenesis permease subunit